MHDIQAQTENFAPEFAQKRLEQVCFHALGLLEQNREYLEQHLGAAGADESTMSALADMRTACARLDRSLGELLALLACARGAAQPAVRVFSLGTVINALESQREPIRRQLGIELVIDTAGPPEQLAVCADSEWAEQVCLHLLSNALHACDAGGHITVALKRERGELHLSVRDDGCGLPESSAAAQLENRRHFLGGAQVGLVLCREYCRLMGWSLELKSLKKGTEALVTIPAHAPAAAHAVVELCAESRQERQRRELSLGRFMAGELAGMKLNETKCGK